MAHKQEQPESELPPRGPGSIAADDDTLVRLDRAIIVLNERNERLGHERRMLRSQLRNYQNLLSDLRKIWYAATPASRQVARQYFSRRGLDLNEPFRLAAFYETGLPVEVEATSTPRKGFEALTRNEVGLFTRILCRPLRGRSSSSQ